MRIGIVGFGFMGRTHFQAYAGEGRATIAAIADAEPDRVTAEPAGGNIGGAGVDAGLLARAEVFPSAEEMFAADVVDAVSICVPTPLHADLAVAALHHGLHVLVEKPLALTTADAARVVEEADRHPGLVCLPAMCMRFWPGWTWLRDATRNGEHGAVRSAVFTRLGAVPDWEGAFYRDPSRSGGAILDLHIHDADFVRACFGDPATVESAGTRGRTGGIDHVSTIYRFPDGPALVAAEGGWLSAPAFPFSMRYRVDFERATADFDVGRDAPLVVHGADGAARTIALPAGSGYLGEVAFFLDSIAGRRDDDVLTLRDGLEAVRLIEAERRSVETGAPVAFRDL